MGLGPLLHMMGLFHAVLSGAGRITINFVSCRSMLPDPEFYRECLQQSFDELMTAAAAVKKPAKKTAKTKRKVRRKTSS